MSKPETIATADSPARGGRWKWFVGAAVLAGLIFFGRQGAAPVLELLQSVRELGPWAPVIYIAVYIIAAVAWIPGSLLTLAAGAIFGLWQGTLYTLIGATLGASAAFLVSRYLARGAVERRLGKNEKLAAIDRAIGREGARLIFLLRLSPAFPFNAMNYALGLTGVRLWPYMWTSFLGMAPGTFLYVYAGFTAGQVTIARDAAPHGPGHWIVLGLGLITTIAVTVLVTRVARRAVKSATEGEKGADSGAAS